LQTAALAAARRSAEQLRMLHYWLSQRSAMAGLAEPFAMAEFEFHRMLSEASQNPFLRAASALVEFGVAQAHCPRIRAGLHDFASEKHQAYVTLAECVESGNPLGATQSMATILAVDHNWILKA
jgi:DNA-binding FadR family transcriptional regulator